MTAPASATYLDVLRLREFRVLVISQIVSVLGDQMSKVALTVLVFHRTSSTVLTALAYASTFLPWLLGGPLLATLADRVRRRELLVVCDVGRGLVLLLMAVPGVPLWALFALLFAAELLAPPFEAARAAVMPDVLEGDRLVVGSSLSQVVWQGAQVTGFALGGPLVVLVGANAVFALDGASFLLSAVMLRLYLTDRPAPERDPVGLRSRSRSAPVAALAVAVADAREAVGVLRRLHEARALLVLGVVCGSAAVVPEGLASPYVAELGAGPDAVGLLMAAGALGTVLGAVIIGRLVPPHRRDALVLPLAALSLAPLTLTPVLPGLALPFLGWLLSGIGMAFLLPAGARVVHLVPVPARGRVMGLAQSGIMAGQGVFLLLAGLVANAVPVAWSIGVVGLLTTAFFLPLWRTLDRADDAATGSADAVDATPGAAVAVPPPRVPGQAALAPQVSPA